MWGRDQEQEEGPRGAGLGGVEEEASEQEWRRGSVPRPTPPEASPELVNVDAEAPGAGSPWCLDPTACLLALRWLL